MEKRRKITIDQTQIDADLTHFALPRCSVEYEV